MDSSALTPERMRRSVVAVPPLARSAEGEVAAEENAKLIRHIEQGGVDLLLYGGNAIFYHLRPSEYAQVLETLVASCADSTTVIPSMGPSFGLMMDQVDVLRDFDFPSVMVLPQRDITDPQGIVNGIRAVAQQLERPVVLYLKFDRWIPVETVQAMVEEELVSWIKYAVVRDDPQEDRELRELVDAIGGDRIISGIGEQPAIVHMREYGVNGFTSGCVCIAPARSMQMREAIIAEDFEQADAVRQRFERLEDLRNRIHPIRVLHAAVAACGISRMGPVIPLLSAPVESELSEITKASEELLSWERESPARA